MTERQKWFRDRIGKRVYRRAITGCCSVCDHGNKEGVLIHDRQHADYLHMVESESHLDGEESIRYFDTQEEVDECNSNS